MKDVGADATAVPLHTLLIHLLLSECGDSKAFSSALYALVGSLFRAAGRVVECTDVHARLQLRNAFTVLQAALDNNAIDAKDYEPDFAQDRFFPAGGEPIVPNESLYKILPLLNWIVQFAVLVVSLIRSAFAVDGN